MGRLFWKFFFSTLFAQLLALASIGAAIWLMNRSQDTQQLRADPAAAFLLGAAELTLQHGGSAALRRLLETGEGRFPVFAIDDSGHELLARAVDAGLIAQARQLAGDSGAARLVRESNGARWLLFQPVPPRRALARLEGGEPPRGIPRLMTFATAVLASLIFAALFAWYFSKPIRQLRAAFDAATAGDLRAVAGAAMGKRRDELADLGHDFDRMALQLRALLDSQRRLLHDVSHELRSPLARIQAAIGLAHQSPDKAGVTLERIAHECVQMDKLIGELLDLARLESGMQGMAAESIELAALLAEIVESAAFEAQCAGKQVSLHGEIHASLTGQTQLLQRAIENVVRNAVKYTAAGSEVRIEVSLDAAGRESGPELLLTVADRGPGVAQAELEEIFTPFFRGSSGRAGSGYGLGLAIARRVVEAHGGRIRAYPRPEGGLCVELRLPLGPDSSSAS